MPSISVSHYFCISIILAAGFWCKPHAINNYNYYSTVPNHTCILSTLWLIFPHCSIQFSTSLCYKTHARWVHNADVQFDSMPINSSFIYINVCHIIHICVSYNSQFHPVSSVLYAQRLAFSMLVCMRVRVSRIEYSRRSGSVHCTQNSNI